MIRLFTVLSLLLLAAAWPLRAADAVAALPTSTPLTREQLVSSLAGNLSSHFNLEGDLQLELLRTWTPPAKVAQQ